MTPFDVLQFSWKWRYTISEVFMSHTVLLLNILELNDVVTSKVFIYIVAVLVGRPHSCFGSIYSRTV